jgi:hypothetical protein
MTVPPGFGRVDPLSDRFWLNPKPTPTCKGCGGARYGVRRLPDHRLVYRFHHQPSCRYAR